MLSGFPTVKMSHILFFFQPNPRLMDILIPDTSSLINIHEVYVERVHITNVLNQLFNVQVSREIPHEIRRSRNKLGNFDKPMLQFVRQARRYFPYEQDYEHLIFNQFSPTDDLNRNRGERYNCALALYLVRKRYSGHVIMLTDDMKAHRGLINWYESRFKTTKTWTSLELLLHIYLAMFPKWPYPQVELALQQVNAHVAGTRVEMTKRLREYRRYLMQLHAMLKALPSVKKRGRT